jgi:hypothetical protein
MTEPFDRDLYNRVMTDMPGYGDTTHYALGHRHGYEEAANVAACISAERQQVPVSDEALWGIYHAAYCNARFHQDSNPDDLVPGEAEVNAIIAGIRAVRAAIEAAKENDQ